MRKGIVKNPLFRAEYQYPLLLSLAVLTGLILQTVVVHPTAVGFTTLGLALLTAGTVAFHPVFPVATFLTSFTSGVLAIYVGITHRGISSFEDWISTINLVIFSILPTLIAMGAGKIEPSYERRVDM